MNTDYTHITVVLDRSGSMSNVWNDTVGGLESIIKDNKAEKSKCTFSLYAFDREVEIPVNFADIHVVSENVSEYGISPRGSTALYDAIGKAVNETGNKLRSLPESERPGRVLFVVQTDGEENASREFNATSIKKLVEEQTNKYNWIFNFIGSSQESVLDATKNLGFATLNTTFYSSAATCDTFDLVKTKMLHARSVNYDQYSAATMAFTDQEKQSLSK